MRSASFSKKARRFYHYHALMKFYTGVSDRVELKDRFIAAYAALSPQATNSIIPSLDRSRPVVDDRLPSARPSREQPVYFSIVRMLSRSRASPRVIRELSSNIELPRNRANSTTRRRSFLQISNLPTFL